MATNVYVYQKIAIKTARKFYFFSILRMQSSNLLVQLVYTTSVSLRNDVIIL